jgi:hypothetical protein
MKRLLSISMSALLTLGIVALAPTPAKASIYDCPSGFICLWGENSYQGCFYLTQENQENYAEIGWSTCPAYAVNDGPNSVSNNGSRCRVRFFLNAFFDGPYVYFNSPDKGGITRDPRLSNGGGNSPSEFPGVNRFNWQDQFSSHNLWC